MSHIARGMSSQHLWTQALRRFVWGIAVFITWLDPGAWPAVSSHSHSLSRDKLAPMSPFGSPIPQRKAVLAAVHSHQGESIEDADFLLSKTNNNKKEDPRAISYTMASPLLLFFFLDADLRGLMSLFHPLMWGFPLPCNINIRLRISWMPWFTSQYMHWHQAFCVFLVLQFASLYHPPPPRPISHLCIYSLETRATSPVTPDCECQQNLPPRKAIL